MAACHAAAALTVQCGALTALNGVRLSRDGGRVVPASQNPSCNTRAFDVDVAEMHLNKRDRAHLRAALQEAVVKCSERCLYQSAKW